MLASADLSTVFQASCLELALSLFYHCTDGLGQKYSEDENKEKQDTESILKCMFIEFCAIFLKIVGVSSIANTIEAKVNHKFWLILSSYILLTIFRILEVYCW